MALLKAMGSVAEFLGQFAELGQGRAHQTEIIRWTRRNFGLDSQALRIDLLGSARDDVRGTYNTYVSRLDHILLFNALLLSFGLATLQFSGPFIPGHPGSSLDCSQVVKPDSCIEVKHPWIHTIWVYIVAIELFVPFWSILLLLKSRRTLDSWLEHTLKDLQQMRKEIVSTDVPAPAEWSESAEEAKASEQQGVIADLGRFVIEYQDMFFDLWKTECGPLVNFATWMLGFAASVAVTLTTYMLWVYFVDRERLPETRGKDQRADVQWTILSVFSLGAPALVIVWRACRRTQNSNALRESVRRMDSVLSGLSETGNARLASARGVSLQHLSCDDSVRELPTHTRSSSSLAQALAGTGASARLAAGSGAADVQSNSQALLASDLPEEEPGRAPDASFISCSSDAPERDASGILSRMRSWGR